MLGQSKLYRFVRGEYTDASLRRALASLSDEAGLHDGSSSIVLRALLALRLGLPADSVSKLLDWRTFEAFCAQLLTRAGYSVRENVVLKKPRTQIDIVASDTSTILSIDCKHWGHSIGGFSLARMALSQLERSRRLRGAMGGGGAPIVSVVLTLLDQPIRFAEGVAVVPVRTARDFALSVNSYVGLLTLV